MCVSRRNRERIDESKSAQPIGGYGGGLRIPEPCNVVVTGVDRRCALAMVVCGLTSITYYDEFMSTAAYRARRRTNLEVQNDVQDASRAVCDGVCDGGCLLRLSCCG